jgi:predicted ATPase
VPGHELPTENVPAQAKQAFVRAVALSAARDGEVRDGYPWDLPVAKALAVGVRLDERVTYVIGDNGAGKSTLVEAIAVAAGLNAEGGSQHFAYSTRQSHSSLGDSLTLVRGARRPKSMYFLRAESMFTAASYIESLPREPGGGDPLTPYGGRSLHEQSHGEALLALLINRFGPEGFYVLDEPEAALSPQNCLTFLRRVDQLVRQNSQFVIATHSPLVLAYPHATILECTPSGLATVNYDDAEPVRLSRTFLEGRGRFLKELFGD